MLDSELRSVSATLDIRETVVRFNRFINLNYFGVFVCVCAYLLWRRRWGRQKGTRLTPQREQRVEARTEGGISVAYPQNEINE